MQVIEKELLIKGFIVTSYKPKFPEGIKQLSQWIKEVRKQLIYLLLSSEKLIYLDLVNFSIYIYIYIYIYMYMVFTTEGFF